MSAAAIPTTAVPNVGGSKATSGADDAAPRSGSPWCRNIVAVTHTQNALAQATGTPIGRLQTWFKILGRDVVAGRDLTDQEAVAVMAADYLRKQRVRSPQKVERLFARLALTPPEGTDWLLTWYRGEPDIIEPPLSLDLGWRRSYKGKIFDPADALTSLRDLSSDY